MNVHDTASAWTSNLLHVTSRIPYTNHTNAHIIGTLNFICHQLCNNIIYYPLSLVHYASLSMMDCLKLCSQFVHLHKQDSLENEMVPIKGF